MVTEVELCATSLIGTLSRNGQTSADIAFRSVRRQRSSAIPINFLYGTRSIAMKRTAGLLLVSIVQVYYGSSSTCLSS